MQKLSTIQKRENLNTVYKDGAPGPGGAYHDYAVFRSGPLDGESEPLALVLFQKGSRKESSSRPGVLDTDLLEIVRDRLHNFQAGEFSCRENACALTHIEEALMWLNRRVDDRIERNVLGTTTK